MSLTYRGWICLDEDGTRWGRDESHRALVYPTAAEAREAGAAHVRAVMADAEEDVREREIARFLRVAVAVEVSIRCDVQEQGLAALRWLGEDSNMQALSDARLVGPSLWSKQAIFGEEETPTPTPTPTRTADVALRHPMVGDRWEPGTAWKFCSWADHYEVVQVEPTLRLNFYGSEGPPVSVDVERSDIGKPGDTYLGGYQPRRALRSVQPGDVLTAQGWVRPTDAPTRPEPDPVPNGHPGVWDLVIADMRDRDALGRERYGTPLQPFNGRKSLRDFYQELLDGVVYLRQHLYESEGR